MSDEKPPRYWAVLDGDDVLVAFTATPIEAAPQFDHCPDLEPGRYRWDRAAGRFEPRRESFPKSPAGPAFDADAMKTIALLIEALDQAGIALPEAVKSYPGRWAQTMDSVGDLDAQRWRKGS